MTTADRNPEPNVRTIEGTFYRFHKARYFTQRVDHFYKNFIDTRGKFESPARFAPAHAHCGHFFARTQQIAAAEALFYADIKEWSKVKAATPKDVIQALKENGDDHVFLAVDFDVDRIVDFTDWRSIDEFMRFGTLRWRGKQREFAVQYLAGLICEDQGGNDLTDILGVDAKSFGYKGVIFPSVRALMYDGELPSGIAIRQSFEAIKHMSAAGNIMDLEWQGEQQLKSEWNAVVFSGSELTRSIERITWLDSSGASGTINNPFHCATDDTLELARLRDRAIRGIDPVAAAKEGLLTAVEAETEFYNNTLFVRDG
ncbi:MAG: hypothetical protein ACRD9S_20730 [Pyrinomonadaceae bacterium]